MHNRVLYNAYSTLTLVSNALQQSYLRFYEATIIGSSKVNLDAYISAVIGSYRSLRNRNRIPIKEQKKNLEFVHKKLISHCVYSDVSHFGYFE